MEDDVRAALEIAPDASSHERTIDITTYGASSGKPRRTETWFHHVDGRWFLSGSPGQCDWYANALKDPRMTVHLKHGVTADPFTEVVPITGPDEKHRLVAVILRGVERIGGWTTASAETSTSGAKEARWSRSCSRMTVRREPWWRPASDQEEATRARDHFGSLGL